MPLPYPYRFAPEPITCHRKDTYDAEVRFDGKHYLVGQKFTSRTDAMVAAQKVCDELLVELRTSGNKVLGKFKEAQP